MLPTTEAVPNQLTYASLIRYDELEKMPYTAYIPAFDAEVTGDSLFEVIEQSREYIGRCLIERLLNLRAFPRVDKTLPKGQPDEVATFIDIELDRYRYLIADKRSSMEASEVSADHLLAKVKDAQPVFLNENGRGKFAVVSLNDFKLIHEVAMERLTNHFTNQTDFSA